MTALVQQFAIAAGVVMALIWGWSDGRTRTWVRLKHVGLSSLAMMLLTLAAMLEFEGLAAIFVWIQFAVFLAAVPLAYLAAVGVARGLDRRS
jgi:hypothetical protein